MAHDREAILDRTDLGALADELLGPRRGRGPSATWPCPDPGHGTQTGRTPPVSVFNGRGDIARWHCHACGAGGTAIDLVMVTRGLPVRDAIGWLADRAGVVGTAQSVGRSARRPALHPPSLPAESAAPRALAEYVSACEQYLWSAHGEPWRQWLAARRLSETVLRANRVGADPGAARLARARDLPRRGPAIVLPVLTPERAPAYLQARYLDPDRAGRKYDNPAESLARNPRVALVHTPRASARAGVLVVCEGLPDALTAASAGWRAVAVLGAGLPDAAVARRVAEIAGRDPVVVAFDHDPGGQRGAHKLRELLAPMHRARVVGLEPPAGDLNDWARSSGPAFPRELTLQVAALVPPAPAVPAPALAP